MHCNYIPRLAHNGALIGLVVNTWHVAEYRAIQRKLVLGLTHTAGNNND